MSSDSFAAVAVELSNCLAELSHTGYPLNPPAQPPPKSFQKANWFPPVPVASCLTEFQIALFATQLALDRQRGPRLLSRLNRSTAPRTPFVLLATLEAVTSWSSVTIPYGWVEPVPTANAAPSRRSR